MMVIVPPPVVGRPSRWHSRRCRSVTATKIKAPRGAPTNARHVSVQAPSSLELLPFRFLRQKASLNAFFNSPQTALVVVTRIISSAPFRCARHPSQRCGGAISDVCSGEKEEPGFESESAATGLPTLGGEGPH